MLFGIGNYPLLLINLNQMWRSPKLAKNALAFKVDSLQKGPGMQESKQEVKKVVSLVKMSDNLPSVLSSYKLAFKLNTVSVTYSCISPCRLS